MTIRHNLLTEPLIGVIGLDGTPSRHCLPEVLELLGREGVRSFSALAPYQAHAWHAFLVQVAALALHRAGRDEPRQDAEAWRALLRGLTPCGPGTSWPGDEPWALVVEDLAQPALLQPPVPERSLSKFKPVAHPDELDVLVTSKNHDLKAARVSRPAPEHWLFALLSLQTMQGFLGAGNYGISRMNGGFASRPAVGLVTSLLPGGRWLRDTAVLVANRTELLSRYAAAHYAAQGGLGLVWLEPWDGAASLALERLDPWYIEICRRVRLIPSGEGLVAQITSTKATRIAAQALKGNTGDPWTPVEIKDGKALTIGQGGFHYRLLQELLLGSQYEPAPMQRLHPPDEGKDVFLLTRGLARGQGETNGYHERLLAIPAFARPSLFGAGEERRHAGERSRGMVDSAATVRSRTLRPALFALCQVGADAIAWKHKESEAWSGPWLERFDDAVDDAFFPYLWDALEDAPGSPFPPWPFVLRGLALAVLREAVVALPLPAERHYRAVTAAEGAFWGGFYNAFPDLRTPPKPETDHEHTD